MDWMGRDRDLCRARTCCKDPAQLRRVQALAACLWVVYGAIIGSAPVLVANLLVAGVAGWSSMSPSRFAKLPPASGA